MMEISNDESYAVPEQGTQETFVSCEDVELGIKTDNQNNQTVNIPITSGVLPLRGWNWGPLILPFWWCLFSYCYWQILPLILPPVNVIWRFVLAAKGNEWSWKTGKWKDAEYFNKTQKLWNKAGLVFAIIVLASVAVFVISDLFRTRY